MYCIENCHRVPRNCFKSKYYIWSPKSSSLHRNLYDLHAQTRCFVTTVFFSVTRAYKKYTFSILLLLLLLLHLYTRAHVDVAIYINYFIYLRRMLARVRRQGQFLDASRHNPTLPHRLRAAHVPKRTKVRSVRWLTT